LKEGFIGRIPATAGMIRDKVVVTNTNQSLH
jgi:hypothetical protein